MPVTAPRGRTTTHRLGRPSFVWEGASSTRSAEDADEELDGGVVVVDDERDEFEMGVSTHGAPSGGGPLDAVGVGGARPGYRSPMSDIEFDDPETATEELRNACGNAVGGGHARRQRHRLRRRRRVDRARPGRPLRRRRPPRRGSRRRHVARRRPHPGRGVRSNPTSPPDPSATGRDGVRSVRRRRADLIATVGVFPARAVLAEGQAGHDRWRPGTRR